MTITTTLTDGVTSISLVYDAGSQENYKQMYGAEVRSRLPNVLQHQPDFGAPTPIDAWDGDRQVFLTLDVNGTDWDDVLNKITTLKRMVDGASSQALRYWTVGDVNRVNLQLSVGQTPTTNIPVKFGLVDDSGAYYSGEAYLNSRARLVVVSLVVPFAGEGEETTINNQIQNADFSSTPGTPTIADDWTAIGTPTFETDETYYLSGNRSQSVIASLNDGLKSTAASATATSAVCFVWLAINDDITMTVELYDATATAVLASDTISDTDLSASDLSRMGNGGKTWYRVPLSSASVTVANNIEIRVYASGFDAPTVASTFWIDLAYLHFGTTTAPSAWASITSISNKGTDYVKIWGIQGDAPAILKVETEPNTSSAQRRLYLHQELRGKSVYESDFRSWWFPDATSASGTNSSTTTPLTDTTAINGLYTRTTSTSTTWDATIPIVIYTPAAYATRSVKMMMRVKSNTTSATISMLSSAFFTVDETITHDIRATGKWQLYDFGVLQPTQALKASKVQNPPTFDIEAPSIFLEGTTNGAQVDIDVILIVHVTDGFVIHQLSEERAGPTSVLKAWSDGALQICYDDFGATDFLGEMWTINSGDVENIIRLIIEDVTNDRHVETNYATLTFNITPRTRHLLGTQ